MLYVVLIPYVDDRLVAIKNKNKIDALGTKLLTTFVMKELYDAKNLLA